MTKPKSTPTHGESTPPAAASSGVAIPPSNAEQKPSANWPTPFDGRLIVGLLVIAFFIVWGLSDIIGRDVGRTLINWYQGRGAPNDGPWNNYQSKTNIYDQFDAPTYDLSALQKGVEATRRKLPYQADAVTTLVDVSVINGAEVRYVYVIDEKKFSIRSIFARDTRSQLLSKVCAPEMRRSMEAGASYWFEYRDKKGRHLTTLDFNKSSCDAR